jgi:hypothetical protein
MRCGASFCYRGNAEGVFEVTLTHGTAIATFLIVRDIGTCGELQKEVFVPDKTDRELIAKRKFVVKGVVSK